MPEQPKKSSALKWILIGCAAVVALGVLCTGSCFGGCYWLLKSLVEEASPAGVAHLKAQTRVTDELGALTKVEARLMGSNVQKINSGGSAEIAYDIVGTKGTATALVWMTRVAGTWTVAGYEVTTSSGKVIRDGHRVEIKSGSSGWDD